MRSAHDDGFASVYRKFAPRDTGEQRQIQSDRIGVPDLPTLLVLVSSSDEALERNEENGDSANV